MKIEETGNLARFLLAADLNRFAEQIREHRIAVLTSPALVPAMIARLASRARFLAVNSPAGKGRAGRSGSSLVPRNDHRPHERARRADRIGDRLYTTGF